MCKTFGAILIVLAGLTSTAQAVDIKPEHSESKVLLADLTQTCDEVCRDNPDIQPDEVETCLKVCLDKDS